MKPKSSDPETKVYWPPPTELKEKDPTEKIKDYIRAIVDAGVYLDNLADKGDKLANRITKRLPEEAQLNIVAEEIVKRVGCGHPKKQRRELRGGTYTACLDCRQVLKYPVGGRGAR